MSTVGLTAQSISRVSVFFAHFSPSPTPHEYSAQEIHEEQIVTRGVTFVK